MTDERIYDNVINRWQNYSFATGIDLGDNSLLICKVVSRTESVNDFSAQKYFRSNAFLQYITSIACLVSSSAML
jgi:hypothetical protein